MDPPVARPGREQVTRDQVVRLRLSSAGLAALDDQARAERRTRSDMMRVLLADGIAARASKR